MEVTKWLKPSESVSRIGDSASVQRVKFEAFEVNLHNQLGLAVIAAFGSSLLPGNADAQQKSFKEQLIGTWMIVRCEVVNADGTKGPLVFGSNPLGQFIFTDNGRFAFQIAADLPKFASGDYRKTTPQENETVVVSAHFC